MFGMAESLGSGVQRLAKGEDLGTGAARLGRGMPQSTRESLGNGVQRLAKGMVPSSTPAVSTRSTEATRGLSLWFKQAVHQGTRIGSMADDDPAAQRREQITALLDEAEGAKKAGDAEKLNAVMGKIDELVEQPRDEAGRWTSFGGGVRRPVQPAPTLTAVVKGLLQNKLAGY